MKNKVFGHFLAIICSGAFFLASLQGCTMLGQENPLEPTLTALNAAVAQTMTAVNLEGAVTQSVATAQSAATAVSQVQSAATAESQAQSTQTAQVEEQERSMQATATVTGPVLAELPRYGIDPANGRLGWVHEPLRLELNSYHEFKYGNQHMNVTAADFVLASDIRWDTQYGGSGCGFMFRSNGDQNQPDQYMVMATRFASGHVAFLALKDGEIANFRDFYPRSEDRSFSAESGSTNRLAIVARGNIIEIYTNGVKIGEVDTTQAPKRPALPSAPKPPDDLKDTAALQKYQKLKLEYDEIAGQVNANFSKAMKNFQSGESVYTDGFLAMVALSESGQTICDFENAWLWLLEP